jgi:hypothetical protein
VSHPAPEGGQHRDAGRSDGSALPPLGSWGRLYALVISVLAVDLLLLWWFTEHYR